MKRQSSRRLNNTSTFINNGFSITFIEDNAEVINYEFSGLYLDSKNNKDFDKYKKQN